MTISFLTADANLNLLPIFCPGPICVIFATDATAMSSGLKCIRQKAGLCAGQGFVRHGSPWSVIFNANLEAFTTVLAEIDRRGIQHIVCLG